ncbi:MAG: hypothetical protein RhofKO_06040 [Rhodothermales bacterium]
MDLLVVLAQHAGIAVSRDDLMAVVWPDVIVSDDALNRAVSKLRNALGDTPQAPHYIETIPKRGYCLIAPVMHDPVEATPAPTATSERFPHATARPWAWGLGLLLALVLIGWLTQRPSPPDRFASQPATRMAGTERLPALAPDGRLAFSGRTRGDETYHLFVQPPGSATPIQLTDAPDNDLFATWTPDGQALVFLRCSALGCYPYRVPAVGGPAMRLSDHALAPYGLTHHATEPVLLGVQRDSTTAPYRIHALDLDTQTLTPLTAPKPNIVGDLFPTIRGDGTFVFARHGANGVETILTADLDHPADLREWSHHPARLNGLTWVGDALGFTTQSDDQHALSVWLQHHPNQAPELRFSAPCCLGRLSANATHLVVEQWTEETNLWSLDDDGTATPLLSSTAVDSQPALSPDGTRLAFVSNRTGHAELWVAETNAPDRLQQLTTAEGRVGAPAWSPDGQHIAFEVEHDGTSEVYLVHVDGGPLRPLTTTGAYNHSPRWSPDGRHLTFSSDASGTWGAWSVEVNSGVVTQVAEGFFGQRHADGSLYLARYPEGGIWHLAAPDAEPMLVVSDVHRLDWGSWTLHGNTLTYLARTDSSLHLVQRDVQTRALLRRTPLPTDLPLREPAITTTSQGQIIFARQDRRESDLLLLTPASR